jgi:hypothetical protein
MTAKKCIRRLVTVNPERNPIHFSRLIRSRLGAKPSEIAAQDGVPEEAIIQSIKSAEMYVEVNSLNFSNHSVFSGINKTMPPTTDMILRALKAKKEVGEGKSKKKVHDFATQLKAGELVKGFVEAVQPKATKGGDTNVNVNASANAANFNEAAYQPGFEELIDSISSKVKKQNELPREVGTTNDDVVLIGEGEIGDSADDDVAEDEGSKPPVEVSP